MSPSPKHRLVVAVGLIERYDNAILIVRSGSEAEQDAPWQFPSGEVGPSETPEAAMRRFAWEDLGIGVQIVVGQPPSLVHDGSVEIELRHFYCGVLDGKLCSGPYAELRWVARSELADLSFDELSRPVVEWLITEG